MIERNSIKHHYLRERGILQSRKHGRFTDEDYTHVKRVCKGFEIKNLGENYDLYIQSNTLLLTNVLENFQNISLKIYKLDSARFLNSLELAWQGALKKTKIK